MHIARLAEYGISHLFDNVHLLQYLRADTGLRRTVTVLKSRASAHEPEIASSDITPGGICPRRSNRRRPRLLLGVGRRSRTWAGCTAHLGQANTSAACGCARAGAKPKLRRHTSGALALKSRGGRPFEPGSAHRGKAASEAESQLRQHRADCFQCALRKRREALFMQAGAKARGTLRPSASQRPARPACRRRAATVFQGRHRVCPICRSERRPDHATPRASDLSRPRGADRPGYRFAVSRRSGRVAACHGEPDIDTVWEAMRQRDEQVTVGARTRGQTSRSWTRTPRATQRRWICDGGFDSGQGSLGR